MVDGSVMIEILYEDNHLLGLVKPCNVPVQEDDSHDEDVLNMAKQYLKEKYNKPGNVYLGLVHRLDRPVGGVMIFAKTSKAASRLAKSMQLGEFEKEYLAILDGIPKEKENDLEDYLLKDHQTNTVSVTDKSHGKYSKLHYNILEENEHHSLAHIRLMTGRSHQIRVQFASRGFPLLHDQRYHPNPTKGNIALWAYALSFPHPVTKERIELKAYPKGDVWKEFEVKL